jgi:hypothetical protein
MCALVLAAATSLGLAACHRGGDAHPSARANAPGSPGKGNDAQQSTPAVADTAGVNGGGSSGEKGTMRTPGSSGGNAPPGTTGSGTSSATSGMGAPGTGLNGGLGATQPGQPTGVAAGSENRTTKSNVGNR